MRRLPNEPPAWVREYLTIPFKDGGRDKAGVDCWGGLRLVYAERLGILLPSLDGGYQTAVFDHGGVTKAAAGQVGSGDWQLVTGAAETLDAVLVTRKGQASHVGCMVAVNRMLHWERNSHAKVERIDTSLWSPRIGGLYRFTGGPRLVGRPNPFTSDQIDKVMVAGMTIAQMLEAAGFHASPELRVNVSGVPVPPERWDRVKPKPGRLVTVTIAPGGGGDNSTRLILTIGVIALAIAAPYAAGVTATMGGAFLSAGVMIGGTLLVNALVPPPKNRLTELGEDNSRSNSLTGGSNQARPYGPVPVLLGTHRITPDYAAQPYTEVIGDDQYLRLLFNCGYGPIEMSDFKIGDTPLEEFEGVEIQVRPGYNAFSPTSIYPGVVTELAPNLLLQEADSWQVRTSGTNATELSVDLTFPQGLGQYNPGGAIENFTVNCDVEWSPAGAGTWTPVNGDAGSTGSPTTERMMDFLFRTPEVEAIESGVTTGQNIGWSTNASYPGTKPAYLPSTRYSWEAWFILKTTTAGTYTFGIDSSDAADVDITTFTGSSVRATFYGSHANAGTSGDLSALGAHSVAIALPANARVPIRIRMEARSTPGVIALGWKKPGDALFTLIPSANILQPNTQTDVQGYRYRSFNTETFTGTIATTANRLGQIRRGIAWAVPEGQYDVRIRRTTPDNTALNIIDKVYWTALRTIRTQEPVQLAYQARVALRIKATDQLNGVLENFNFMGSSVLPDWDAVSETWIQRATSNPASCYRAILQHRGNSRPLADSRIDLAELQAFHEECVERGLECNAYLDFSGTVFERCRDVLATGRATFGMRDGKYSVVRDRVQTTPIQHFTPRNSWGFRGSKAFPDVPHAVRVRFINRETGYQQDERIVYADGYSADGAGGTQVATRFEELQTFGCTHTDQAWKHGRYWWAVGKLRPEIYELNVDAEHLVCNAGDLVLVTHDVPLWGLGYGRVVSVLVNGSGDATGVTLDDVAPMESGPTYKIRFRLEDGASLIRQVNTVEGNNRSVTFTTPIPAASPHPKAGDLWMFGPDTLESRELLVKAMSHDTDLSAKLILVDHAPGVHDADTGEIPDYESGITRPPNFSDGPDVPVVEQILSDDTVMVREPDGSLRARMVIYLRPQGGLRPMGIASVVRTRVRATPPYSTLGPWHTRAPIPIDNNAVAVDDVEEGVTYQIRLRNVAADGRASGWTDIIEHTIVGKTRPPPDVEEFEVIRLPDGTRRFSWVLGDIPPDVAGVLIRFRINEAGSPFGWADLGPLHTGVLEGASPTELPDPYAAGTYTFGIKMIDTSGIESINALIINATLGPGPTEGVAVSVDAREQGWPGEKEDCHIGAPDRYLWADGAMTWATTPATWAAWTSWTTTPASPIRYTHLPIDLGLTFDYEPACSFDASGDAVVEFRHAASSDDLEVAAWEPIGDYAGTLIDSRYAQFRITVTATGPAPIVSIRQFTMLFRAQVVQQVISDLHTGTLAAPYRIGPGDFRVPIAGGMFAIIRHVSLSFNGVGQGWTWEVIDKAVIPGPRVKIYDENGDPADALVDIIVRGLAGQSAATLLAASLDDPDITLDYSDRDKSIWMAIL